jgi:uncharacterized membrane protein YbhN (UPF0104 family)
VAWAVPLSPGGLGVGEVAFVSTLGLSGVAPAAALGAVMGFRLTVYVVALMSAPLLLFRTSTAAVGPVGQAGSAGPDSP